MQVCLMGCHPYYCTSPLCNNCSPWTLCWSVYHPHTQQRQMVSPACRLAHQLHTACAPQDFKTTALLLPSLRFL